MSSNRVVFAALALACVLAAGTGGYLATREATQGTVAAGAVGPAPTLQGTPAATPAPVEPAVAGPPAHSTAVSASADPATASARQPETVRPRETGAVERPAKRQPAPVRPRPEAPAGSAGTPAAAAVTPADPPAADPPSTTAADPAQIVDGREGPSPALTPDAGAPAGPVASTAAPRADFDELVVQPDSVIGLQLRGGVSSGDARVEDRVEARVVRDVRVGGRVAIAAGARALGSVTLVERGGRFKERARLGIRFHTLVLADGSQLPISTDTIYRYGDAPGDSSAKKIGGGAVAGAILGAILGGAKGAAVGATAGAGGGTAMVMAGDRSAAAFAPGAEVTARILAPVAVTVDR